MAGVPGARIEDGWQRLADGLHIQRYFLHVHPRRRTEVHGRLAGLDVADVFKTFLLARTLSCTSLRAMTCSDQGDDVHQNGRS